MKSPIVFISRNRVREGRLDEFKQHYLGTLEQSQASRPGTLFQYTYVDEQAAEVVVIRVLADAEALDRQVQGSDDRSKASYQFIAPSGIEIYGRPNPYTMEMIAKVAGSGIPVRVDPDSIGGFMRLKGA